MDRVREIPIKLSDHNQQFFHRTELANTSENSTAATSRTKKGTTGRKKEGTKEVTKEGATEGRSTGLSMEEIQEDTNYRDGEV